jgi:transcriptional regulator
MYKLPVHDEPDKAVVLDFIGQHPFAFLSGCSAAGEPVATQVPVFIEHRGDALFLSGHLMKGTDHHRAFGQNPAALCVFTGPHTYVSATLYSNTSQASTWNYISVHVRGTLRFLGGEALEAVLQKTSLHFEGGKDSSTVYENLPRDYRERLNKAIVAFEVEVSSIHPIFKLSQDRDHESYRTITKSLAEGEGDAPAIAAEMQKREGDLFIKAKPGPGVS